jgi:hypothetical protein
VAPSTSSAMDEKTRAPRPITRRPYGGHQPQPRGPRCAGEDWVDAMGNNGQPAARGANGLHHHDLHIGGRHKSCRFTVVWCSLKNSRKIVVILVSW